MLKKIKTYLKNNFAFTITTLITIIISFFITKLPLTAGFTYEFSFIINIALLLLYPIAFKLNNSLNIYKGYFLLTIPLIIQLFTIKNLCDPFKGFAFYFLIPTITLFLIHNLLSFLQSKYRRTFIASPNNNNNNIKPSDSSIHNTNSNNLKTLDKLSESHDLGYSDIPLDGAVPRLYGKYYFIIFISLFAELYLIYSQPQIFFYNSFWGYFQGSLYDIGFSISKPLVWLAAFKIINGLILKIMTDITLLEKAKTLRLRSVTPKKQKIILFSLIILSSIIYFNQNTLGMKTSHKDIQKTLGGYYKTKNFNIYYSSNNKIAKNIKLIAKEHEMSLDQLKKEYNIKWNKKIDSYIFESSTQKKTLMGAGNTLIAKPWLGEIYINYSSNFPHPHLKHELSHIIAAKFSDRWLKIPMKYGIIPQMGIVEGFAVSSENEYNELTLFEQMAILKKINKFPPLEKMVSFEGFWSYNSHFAYKTVGGFLKFLKIKYGTEKIKDLYKKESFKKVYNKTTLELKSEYLNFLSKIKIDEKYIPKTESNYSQKSVFKRVCPHDLEEIKNHSEDLIRSKGFDTGIREAQKLLKLEPNNINHKIYLSQLSIKNKKYQKALSYLPSLPIKMHGHASQQIPKASQQYIQKLQADITWLNNKNTSSSLKLYEDLIKKDISTSTYREIYIKIKALKDKNIEKMISNYLLERKSIGSYIYHFENIKLEEKSFNIVNYLYGRYFFNIKNYKEALFYMNKTNNTLPYSFLVEILKIKIQSNFFLKNYKKMSKNSENLIKISKTNGMKEYGKNYLKIKSFFELEKD